MELSPSEMRVKEIAKMTKRPISTLYQWIESNEFPVKRYGGIIAIDREVFKRWWETTGKYKEWKKSGKRNNCKRLTNDELNYIIENYTNKSISQLARDLNRAYSTIYKAIKNMEYRIRPKKEKIIPLIPEIISNEKFYLNWRVINYYATKEFQNIKL